MHVVEKINRSTDKSLEVKRWSGYNHCCSSFHIPHHVHVYRFLMAISVPSSHHYCSMCLLAVKHLICWLFWFILHTIIVSCVCWLFLVPSSHHYCFCFACKQKISEENRKRASNPKYPYRKGSAGYAVLEQELVCTNILTIIYG